MPLRSDNRFRPARFAYDLRDADNLAARAGDRVSGQARVDQLAAFVPEWVLCSETF